MNRAAVDYASHRRFCVIDSNLAKAKVELHLAKVPVDDPEAQVQMVIDMGTEMAGRKPTEEEIAEVRDILGLPAKPRAKKRRKPKAKAVKTRKR